MAEGGEELFRPEIPRTRHLRQRRPVGPGIELGRNEPAKTSARKKPGSRFYRILRKRRRHQARHFYGKIGSQSRHDGEGIASAKSKGGHRGDDDESRLGFTG